MGLRRGELLGLKWSDIDLDKGIIHVRRQTLFIPLYFFWWFDFVTLV